MNNIINKIGAEKILDLNIRFHYEWVPILSHWIEYKLSWYFEMYFDEGKILYNWDTSDLCVNYNWEYFSYNDFFQKYDEFTNWYKNYKELSSIIREGIENHFNNN